MTRMRDHPTPLVRPVAGRRDTPARPAQRLPGVSLDLRLDWCRPSIGTEQAPSRALSVCSRQPAGYAGAMNCPDWIARSIALRACALVIVATGCVDSSLISTHGAGGGSAGTAASSGSGPTGGGGNIKYGNKESAAKYSKAPDYFQVVKDVIKEMYRQVGNLELNKQGITQRGLLIRHLFLPNNLAGTDQVLKFLFVIR